MDVGRHRSRCLHLTYKRRPPPARRRGLGILPQVNEREIAAGLATTPDYRYADVVDNRLFLAGQVPQDESGEIVSLGDPAGQATRCLENLRTVVSANGFAIGDVRCLTIYVVGWVPGTRGRVACRSRPVLREGPTGHPARSGPARVLRSVGEVDADVVRAG